MVLPVKQWHIGEGYRENRCPRGIRVVLFEVYYTDHAGYAEDFIFGYVDGVIFVVIGDGEEAIGVGAFAQAFHDKALLAGGKEVRFIPLYKI